MPPRTQDSIDQQKRTISNRIRLLQPFKTTMEADIKAGVKAAKEPFKERRKAINDEANAAGKKAGDAKRAEWRPKLEAEKARIALLVDPEKALETIRKKVKRANAPKIEAQAQREYEALRKSIEENGGVEPGPVGEAGWLEDKDETQAAE